MIGSSQNPADEYFNTFDLFCVKEIEVEEEEENYEDQDVKPFICAQCGKTFKQNHQLKYHMNQHLDVKPFVCNVCNKTFMNSRNLRDHSTIHTGIKFLEVYY